MSSLEQCFDRNERLHSVIISIAAFLHQNLFAEDRDVQCDMLNLSWDGQ